MISMKVEGIDALEAELEGDRKRLPRELSVAVNATSRKVVTNMSRQIRDEITAKSKEVKKVLKVNKKSNKNTLSSNVRLSHEKRLSLKAFNPRQTRKGISYKISKREGRKMVPGGFMGPRPGSKAPRLGGHAFKRVGKNRTPIVKLHAVSPWAVYQKNHMRPATVRDAEAELRKQIERRIRFLRLKKQGAI